MTKSEAQCPHTEYSIQCDVSNIEDDTIKMIDITGKCVTCGKPLRFRGNFGMGVEWGNPTLSVDRQQLRVPCVVAGDEVDENKRRLNLKIRGFET